jgi:predicted Zn-dependent peptidase
MPKRKELMNYSKEKLENGSILIKIPVDGVKSVSLFYFIKAGSRDEGVDNNGVAHFLEHMIFKGTQKRPNASVISQEIDSIGAYVNAFTDKENTAYYIKAAGNHLPKALEILSDMMLNSSLSDEEIEREKGVIIEEIKMYRDNPSAHVGDIYEGLVYKGSSIGRPIAGTEETVSKFNQKFFTDFYNNYYAGENIILVLAGNLSNENGLAKKYLQSFNKLNKNIYREAVPNSSSNNILLEKRDINQGQFQLGVRGLGFNDEDKIALKIISIILGGTMSSRLFSEVRERKGLAYSIHTVSEFLSDTGQLTTLAGVKKDNIYQAIQIVIDNYQRLSKDLNEKELQRAKDYYKGTMAISLEDTSKIATYAAIQEYYSGNILSVDEWYKKIDEVSLERAKGLSEKIFSQNLNLAVVGPYEDEEKFAKML